MEIAYRIYPLPNGTVYTEDKRFCELTRFPCEL